MSADIIASAGTARQVPTVSRRAALRTGGLAAIMAGLLGSATTTLVAATPAPTIDQAEALLLDVERILVQFDGETRANLSAELNRLSCIADSADPHDAAAEWPRHTGHNRPSLAWARADALAHAVLLPRYRVYIDRGFPLLRDETGLDEKTVSGKLVKIALEWLSFDDEVKAQYGADGEMAIGIAMTEIKTGVCVQEEE